MRKLAVDLFAGGGGVTSGIVQSGLYNVISVERSPVDVFNSGYGLLHNVNFPEHLFVNQYIQEWIDKGYQGVGNRQVDYLHCSPPCQSFSYASGGKNKETMEDYKLGLAIAQIICELEPEMITLEQVIAYQSSSSFDVIFSALTDYQVSIHFVNLYDYDHAQSRKRMFLIAHKRKKIYLQPQVKGMGWGKTFELEDKDAVLIDPYDPKRPTRSIDMPFHTLLRTYFIYETKYVGKNPNHPPVRRSARKDFIKYKTYLGELKSVPFSALAIACGFPATYQFVASQMINGAAIGNAFSPKFIKDFLLHNVS